MYRHSSSIDAAHTGGLQPVANRSLDPRSLSKVAPIVNRRYPMSAKKLVLIVAVTATAISAVYANQRPSYGDALPAAEGIEIPRIVITAKREHGAE